MGLIPGMIGHLMPISLAALQIQNFPDFKKQFCVTHNRPNSIHLFLLIVLESVIKEGAFQHAFSG